METQSETRRMHRVSLVLAALVVAWVLPACSSSPRLAVTPYIMRGEQGRVVYEALPESLKTPEIPIMYFTDRADEAVDGRLTYTHERSSRVDFGTVIVRPTRDMTWDELVEASTSGRRKRALTLRVSSVEKCGDVASLRDRLQAVDGRLVYPRSSSEAFWEDMEEFQRCMEPWLEPGTDNGVVVYVHGVYTPFPNAAIRLADAWHASGRHGVPIMFSWPTGKHGFKPFNYAHDQESGDFAVRDLKLLLTALALNERVARVHVVAWSRGNEVVATAVRELHEEVLAAHGQTLASQLALGMGKAEMLDARAHVRDAAEVLKLESILFIAADLGLDVFEERLFAERVLHATRRLVVYSSRRDKALGIADIFAQSRARLGQATPENIDPQVRKLIAGLPSVEMIECDVSNVNSHGYLFEHPAALSDMIKVIRDQESIGPSRPLKPIEPGFWLLDEDYLRPE